MFQFMPTQMEPASSNRQISNSPDVISYLQHNLSADGNAGSYVFIGNDGFVDAKYGSILILFGQYGNLAGLDYESSMAFFTPESHKERMLERVLRLQVRKSMSSVQSGQILIYFILYII